MVVLIQILLKKLKHYFQKISNEGKTLKIITVGSKGYDQLKRAYKNILLKEYHLKIQKLLII